MALVGKKAREAPAPGFVMPKINPLSDPHLRQLVRMAAVHRNYDAMRDAHALAASLVPPDADLWSVWVDGLETLSREGDEELAMFVKFTREAAGIDPWGNVPAAASRRLRALTG